MREILPGPLEDMHDRQSLKECHQLACGKSKHVNCFLALLGFMSYLVCALPLALNAIANNASLHFVQHGTAVIEG